MGSLKVILNGNLYVEREEHQMFRSCKRISSFNAEWLSVILWIKDRAPESSNSCVIMKSFQMFGRAGQWDKVQRVKANMRPWENNTSHNKVMPAFCTFPSLQFLYQSSFFSGRGSAGKWRKFPSGFKQQYKLQLNRCCRNSDSELHYMSLEIPRKCAVHIAVNTWWDESCFGQIPQSLDFRI